MHHTAYIFKPFYELLKKLVLTQQWFTTTGIHNHLVAEVVASLSARQHRVVQDFVQEGLLLNLQWGSKPH